MTRYAFLIVATLVGLLFLTALLSCRARGFPF